MPKLVHKTACKKCPFRRKSAPGWLGADTPENFAANAVADESVEPLPCHPSIDYSDPNWRETQYPDAPYCAGALVMLANQFKMPKMEPKASLVHEVDQDPEVFMFTQEFIDHHRKGPASADQDAKSDV